MNTNMTSNAATTTPLAVDRTVSLNINGSQQRLRLCAMRPGLPPILIVQGGPALPLLHEVRKFQQRLRLEQDFLVAYWGQRGCGPASRRNAMSTSMHRQVEDLRSVLQWLHHETGQRVLLFGISIGATIALQAAEHESDRVRAVIAISPDSRTADSDAGADAFLKAQAAAPTATRQIRRRVETLGAPPYITPTPFQRRARLLSDLGTIERRMTFNGLLRELLVSLIRTYGIIGSFNALRNMNIVLRRLLPEIATLDLLTRPPRISVPVHYIYGEQDALMPLPVIDALPPAIAAPTSTVLRVADAGHMVHFDQPAIVRSVVERA